MHADGDADGADAELRAQAAADAREIARLKAEAAERDEELAAMRAAAGQREALLRRLGVARAREMAAAPRAELVSRLRDEAASFGGDTLADDLCLLAVSTSRG